MKTVNHIKLNSQLIRLIIPAIFLCSLLGTAYAQLPPGFKGGPTNMPLDSWSFNDHTNWTSDSGYPPISFTNLNFGQLGNGRSLVVDTNIPAWLNYSAYENISGTNLTVLPLDSGSVTFWFAPSSWSSTNAGGTGPGEWGRLFEVGSYTSDSSYGLWSIYVDDGGNNLYFSAQTNDLSSSLTTYLSAPISWTTNYFHFIALTYSPTNTALYLDGVLATNGPGVTIYPGPDVLTNGFFIGADETGLYQANGLFNSVATYSYPLSSNDVQTLFNYYYTYYEITPWNQAMFNIISAPTSATNGAVPDVIIGPGFLQLVGSGTAITSSNVWITNVVVTANGSGTNNMVLQFTIQGGSNNVPYDCFANSVLSFGTNGVPWSWMGQGFHGNSYLLSNLPPTACFLILGGPQDSDNDGLTDAYERLVSKTDPNNPSTDGTGMSDGWEIYYFGSISNNPSADPDGDGLTTLQEYQMRAASYNPTRWDSNTNLVSDAYEDYSGDGLANFMEQYFGLNFMNNNPTWETDTSGDGLPDAYQAMAGSGASGLPAYSKDPIQ
jgi:hypothetical protein